MRSHTTTVTIPCPHQTEGARLLNGECEAEIVVELEWTPGELYGTDADGRRGMWVPGGFSVCGIAETCENGCQWDAHDLTEIEQRADRAARDASRNDEPDYDPHGWYED